MYYGKENNICVSYVYFCKVIIEILRFSPFQSVIHFDGVMGFKSNLVHLVFSILLCSRVLALDLIHDKHFVV